MGDRASFLVIGGDSLVGGGLHNALVRRGHRTYVTTRRISSLSNDRVFLDFESETPFVAPPDVGYAFVVAAATNYDRCEKDPLAQKINAEFTPRMIGWLLEQGIFVTFISTNSVFGGQRPWPNEDDPHEPGIPYAMQKHQAELALRKKAAALGAEVRLNIVRLTKILDRNTSPLPAWFDAWQRGQAIQPFSDLIFAPMSVQFVGEALATIGEKRVSGDLHLSGAANVSYVEFASALAAKLNVAPSLMAPTTATAKGVHIAFKPKYSGLGMQRTTALTGLTPQTLAAVLSDLLPDN